MFTHLITQKLAKIAVVFNLGKRVLKLALISNARRTQTRGQLQTLPIFGKIPIGIKLNGFNFAVHFFSFIAFFREIAFNPFEQRIFQQSLLHCFIQLQTRHLQQLDCLLQLWVQLQLLCLLEFQLVLHGLFVN